jgi:hypothetical protein
VNTAWRAPAIGMNVWRSLRSDADRTERSARRLRRRAGSGHVASLRAGCWCKRGSR